MDITTEPRLSIVISTFNRCEILVESLLMLAKQDLPGDLFEVIISDDGSTDGTAETIRRMRSQLNFKIDYEWHSNRGPGFTHNVGIRKASCTIILLLADDVLLHPKCLSSHLMAHAEHPEANCAILGNVEQSPRLNQTVFLKHWDPHHSIREFRDRAEIPYTFFWANNISFKRDFILSHGLFGESYGVGGAAAHEDVELGCRLAKYGLQIFHYKDAAGHHLHYETLESAIKRAYERGFNWPDFVESTSECDLSVRYHVVDKNSLLVHLKALFQADRSRTLSHNDKTIFMLLKNLLRLWLYNSLTVPFFWIPFLERAEKVPAFAAMIHGSFYRGVAHFSFRKGVRDNRQESLNQSAARSQSNHVR